MSKIQKETQYGWRRPRGFPAISISPSQTFQPLISSWCVQWELALKHWDQ